MPLFCVNCGRPYEAFEKFCNSCGKTLPRPNLDIPQTPETNKLREHSTSLPPQESEPTTPEEQLIEPPPIPIEKEVLSPSIPFARLTLFSALAIVSISSVSFAVFDDIYRGKAYLLPFACVVLIACAASLGQARSSQLVAQDSGLRSERESASAVETKACDWALDLRSSDARGRNDSRSASGDERRRNRILHRRPCTLPKLG